MQSTNWAPEHSDALREHLAKGMSFSEIASAINDRFNTAYSRNATIGRARRMGLAGAERPGNQPMHWPALSPRAQQPNLRRSRQRRLPEVWWPIPTFERTETAKLRCVEVDPRHLSLIDLEPGDCRYPYGGDEDGEAITFCGHKRREGLKLLRAAFRPDARPRHRVGTGRRYRLADIGGGGMKRAVLMAVRMKPLPRHHRIAHLRALIRQDPASSSRCEELVALLRDEVTGLSGETSAR